ncbi:hypothetical protein AB0G04_07720 [Actinoplanes sp. NPDC023801]|uniref:hypothetical protein n=1 Tax=Actinoplanes sp. NPDC023801 TaxID=3154595 RepID=UPI0033F635E0
MAPGSNGWFRRRTPRLSGTLHIRDDTGHELVVPLRGRASLLTAGGTGLHGYGEVWAVHTTAPAAETSLMIAYSRDESAKELASGLCAAGQTIQLDDVTFTWRVTSPSPNVIPRQRAATSNLPRNLRIPPARTTNTRGAPADDGGLRSRLRNMVRVVTQATRH